MKHPLLSFGKSTDTKYIEKVLRKNGHKNNGSVAKKRTTAPTEGLEDEAAATKIH